MPPTVVGRPLPFPSGWTTTTCWRSAAKDWNERPQDPHPTGHGNFGPASGLLPLPLPDILISMNKAVHIT